MRIGTLAYTTIQGLSLLVKDFYDNGVVTDVWTIKHPKYENHYWYGKENTGPILRNWLKKMDVMVFFETPFYWQLIRDCRYLKIPTILIPMYECMPETLPEQPDLIINPSTLDQQYYPSGTYIPVPIPNWIRWKQRERARIFIHNAGNLGAKGRNGTLELLGAIQYVQSPIRLIVRTQIPIPTINDSRVSIRIGSVPNYDLYEEGDVFIFPEKFNGLSLPLQEAYASGMLIMATNRDPMNKWLPTEPLIQSSGNQNRVVIGGCRTIEEAIVDSTQIAHKIDHWYNQDISYYSLMGKSYGIETSWEILKPRYIEAINVICSSNIMSK